MIKIPLHNSTEMQIKIVFEEKNSDNNGLHIQMAC